MVRWHTGYPGGLKERTLREQLERRPTEVIRKAVKGMLPKNRLAAAQLTQAEGVRRPGASARGAGSPKTPGALEARMAEIAQYLGTGKRKTSVARVILRPGDGKTWINGRTLEEYFPRAAHRDAALAPLDSPAPRAPTTCACACTAAASPARPAPSATASPGRSSRPIPSCACR